MRTFLLGSAIALVIGIAVGVVYTTVGITTAQYDATEYVQLPEGLSE